MVTVSKRVVLDKFPKLSGGSIKLYMYLKANDGRLDMVKTIEVFNVTPRTIKNWMEELENHGLIGEKQEVTISELEE